MQDKQQRLSKEQIDHTLATHSADILCAASADGKQHSFAVDAESGTAGHTFRRKTLSGRSLEEVALLLKQEDVELAKDVKKYADSQKKKKQ